MPEIQPKSESVNTKERSGKALKAIQIVDRIFSEASFIQTEEQKVIAQTQPLVQDIKGTIASLSSKDEGCQTMRARLESYPNGIHSSLSELDTQSKSSTASLSNTRKEIEANLNQLVSSDDPAQSSQLSRRVKDTFDQSIRLIRVKANQRAEVKGKIGHRCEENSEESNRLYRKIQAELQRDLSNSKLGRYTQKSKQLHEYISSSFRHLSAVDRAFIEKSGQATIFFNQLVDSLVITQKK